MNTKKSSKDCALKKIKHILVVGLGISGLSGINYLTKQIEFKKKLFKVSVYDKNKSIKEQKGLLKNLDIEDFFTGDIKFEFLNGKSHIFLSPGVNPKEVKKFGHELNIINDISLFLEHLSCSSSNLKVIGVTGTNGKTTTCLFLEHLLLKAGYKTKALGNLGIPPLDLINDLEDIDVLVLEVSSFQLNPFNKNGLPGRKIDVGIFLNFTEDHLDMHDNMDDYLQSKITLLKSSIRQVVNSNLLKILPQRFADITFKHEEDKNIEMQIPNEISKREYIVQSIKNSKFIVDNKGFEVNIDDSNLIGMHNELNIAAAFAAFRCLDLSFIKYQDAIMSFKGVPHRLEWVRDIDGIKFYNDSKATNAASTVAALEFLKNKNIFLIVGGDSKKLSMEPLKKYVTKNVSQLLLIGKDALIFKKLFKNLSKLKISMCNDLNHAVSEAFNHAHSGDIILLSPACSSHDMYKNYIDRGEHFKKIVHALR
jgi:UDP-N-acetylmuramoylalanine--D-glutamate ligase